MQNFPNSLTTPETIMPVVGMKATICMWSDRHPAEVTRVSKSGKTCWIKGVTSKCISGTERDGTAKYEYGTVPSEGYERKVSFTKNAWKLQGGSNVWLGRQERYCDPSF